MLSLEKDEDNNDNDEKDRFLEYDKIIDNRTHNGRKQFLVKWKNNTDEWLNRMNIIIDMKDDISRYSKEKKKRFYDINKRA